jgi:hypothetical protein
VSARGLDQFGWVKGWELHVVGHGQGCDQQLVEALHGHATGVEEIAPESGDCELAYGMGDPCFAI